MADGGPVRDLMKLFWTKKGISPVFGNAQITWEGENERLTLWFERFVRRALSAISQPEIIRFEVDGRIVDHVTDFLVERPSGFVRLGVKGVTGFAYAPWLADKFGAIARAYAQKGLLFETVTSEDLYRLPLADCVDEIWRARRVPVEAEARDAVLSALASGPMLLRNVVTILGIGDPRRALALHAEGAITVDLRSGPIDHGSTVRLGNIDLGSYTVAAMMDSLSQHLTDASTLPGLYEDWPGDPGANPDDSPPFPMRNGERYRFWDAVFFYKRRTTTGLFCFEPEDGATPINRSAWRLRKEFAERILVRLDRGIRTCPSRAHEAAAKGLISSERLRSPQRHVWDNRTFIPLIRQEFRRRASEGLPRLPISGPRELGGCSEPHDPPRDLAELIANLAQDEGISPGEQPSWKTVAKTLKKVAHLDVIPADQLVDGRTIADHPLRTDGILQQSALDVIETDFATREFESVSGTVTRVAERIDAQNALRSSEDKLPQIGRTAVDNLISSLPGMDVCEAKLGRKLARQTYDIVGKLPIPIEPFTIVEFDWHRIDLENKYPAQAEFLSELAGIRIPRLWLIAGIDTTTSWPAGYVVVTPRPVAFGEGRPLCPIVLNGSPRQVAAFEFLGGKEPDPSDDLVAWVGKLGAISARLHAHSRRWKQPPDFQRKVWDFDAMLGTRPLWGDWRAGLGLREDGRQLLQRVADTLKQRLDTYGHTSDRFGLVHADLRLANLLVDGARLGVIDFDDCGFSWFFYDFAAAVSFMEHEPVVAELQALWLDGYRDIAPVSHEDELMLPIFVMLRRMLLTAWIASHSDTETARRLGNGLHRCNRRDGRAIPASALMVARNDTGLLVPFNPAFPSLKSCLPQSF